MAEKHVGNKISALCVDNQLHNSLSEGAHIRSATVLPDSSSKTSTPSIRRCFKCKGV